VFEDVDINIPVDAEVGNVDVDEGVVFLKIKLKNDIGDATVSDSN